MSELIAMEAVMSASGSIKSLLKKRAVVEKTQIRQYLRQTSEKICQIKQKYTEIRWKAKVPKT